MFFLNLSKHFVYKPKYYIYSILLANTINFDHNKQVNHSLQFITKSVLLIIEFS